MGSLYSRIKRECCSNTVEDNTEVFEVSGTDYVVYQTQFLIFNYTDSDWADNRMPKKQKNNKRTRKLDNQLPKIIRIEIDKTHR